MANHDLPAMSVPVLFSRPGVQTVLNLEGHCKHASFVGEDGVLVHNSRNGVYNWRELRPQLNQPQASSQENQIFNGC